jgi:hypothetical protein
MTLTEKALSVAITQVGKEEMPRGSNWGEPVKTFLASVGIRFPASWCAAFVYWSFDQASNEMGLNNPLIRTAGVLDHWHRASAVHKIYKDYQPGDIFIMDHGGGLGHTGFIEFVEVTDGQIILNTVEGNTNDTGAREGYEVCRRKRKVSSIIGALRY